MVDGQENHDPALKTTLDVPPEPAVERRIGAYRVLRELGHGGMGTVYLAARADDQYQKRVAIKVVRGLDSDQIVRHFRRERQILAALDHPNIARLLDGGTTDDGLPYFVMERVEGEPIDGFCDERKLSVVERLRLFQGVCAAVQYAHQNLVVHRDLKPKNILVDAQGVPKLLDFGIAKLLNPEISGEAATGTALAMTPEYASPEQMRGRPITTATDVYSLGVVLYELLTGHRPYGRQARDSLELLRAVCEEEPERPSTAVGRTEQRTLPSGAVQTTTPESASRTREGTPEKLRRRLRGDLDNIILMALRKEPQRRYRSVEAFSEDIRRYLEGRPVTAHKATVWYRSSKFVRRNVLGVGAAAAVFLLAVGFGVVTTVQSHRIARERDRANHEAARASAINTFLLDTLGSANPFEGQGRETTVLEALRLATAKLEKAFSGQPDVEASVRYTIGLTYLRLGRYTDAEPMLRSAMRLLTEHHSEDSRAFLPTVAALAVVRQEQGDLTEAEALLRRSLATARRARAATQPSEDETAILSNLALLLQEKNELGEAEKLMREVLSNERRASGPGSLNVGIDLNNLGLLIVRRGRLAEGEPLLREAIGIFEKADYPGLPLALGNLGEALTGCGRYTEAEPVLARAAALGAARLGDQSQDLAKTRVKYGACLLGLKRYAAAEEQALAALPVMRASLGDSHEWTQRTVRLLVGVYEAWGKPEKAAHYRASAPKGP